MKEYIKLNQIKIIYTCPKTQEKVSKNVTQYDMYAGSNERYGDWVIVNVKCKCGKKHEIALKD